MGIEYFGFGALVPKSSLRTNAWKYGLFGSRDEGESWTSVAAHLPDVLCVRAGSV